MHFGTVILEGRGRVRAREGDEIVQTKQRGLHKTHARELKTWMDGSTEVVELLSAFVTLAFSEATIVPPEAPPEL